MLRREKLVCKKIVKFFEVFATLFEVFASVSRFSDGFGRIWIHSDLRGRIWMYSEASGQFAKKMFFFFIFELVFGGFAYCFTKNVCHGTIRRRQSIANGFCDVAKAICDVAKAVCDALQMPYPRSGFPGGPGEAGAPEQKVFGFAG